ncbi:MAG: hypothetical protein GY820_35630 [Gammaproteobacteria bacterium]|nr:hypothetical protein [Gammaproteobacteria bacterium]
MNEWKTSALTGYQNSHQMNKEKTLNQQQDKKKIKQLERELRRKEKALAETAALLVCRINGSRSKRHPGINSVIRRESRYLKFAIVRNLKVRHQMYCFSRNWTLVF